MSSVTPTDSGAHAALAGHLLALISGERDWLANLANAAAAIHSHLAELNWAGFYLWRDGQLILGPFIGRPACVRIARGRGVCGAAAARRQTVVVPDVHTFPGHIACDAASNSEIVIPLLTGQRLLGVLDLDSPRPGRFTTADQDLLEPVAAILAAGSDWPEWIGEAAP